MNRSAKSIEPNPSAPGEITLPRLTDEVAVQIYDFFYQFLNLFEARYGAQIDRFYADLGEDIELDANYIDPPPPF
jgi:hypothetical protein